MSEADRDKWDARYGSGDYVPRRSASPFLISSLPKIGVGEALVTACGAGRNAFALAEAGFGVDAFDISDIAISQARAEAQRRQLSVNFQAFDLDEIQLGEASYDLITVFRYMNRPLWPRLVSALTRGGWLMMEMHLQAPRPTSGPPPGPFRVQPNELLDAFSSMRIESYEEVIEPSDRGEQPETALARLLARKE